MQVLKIIRKYQDKNLIFFHIVPPETIIDISLPLFLILYIFVTTVANVAFGFVTIFPVFSCNLLDILVTISIVTVDVFNPLNETLLGEESFLNVKCPLGSIYGQRLFNRKLMLPFVAFMPISYNLGNVGFKQQRTSETTQRITDPIERRKSFQALLSAQSWRFP